MFMQDSSSRVRLALVLISGVPRVLAAFLLPNAFGDAYAYIKEVETLTAKLSAGTFRLTDLYGFWLPLYQLVCAILSLLFGHPFYVSRIVSALCGAGICLLVYEISLRLTGNRRASLAAFALIALSPLHIFNSASAMTDIPHAFLVVAGVYFILQKRWIAAASLLALAGLTRVDSWMFILLIPALQFLAERRISILACLIMIFPPLFWLYISWKATGDPLACFVARRQYMDWLLSVNPSLASFSLNGIARDTGALLLSTDTAVLAACLIAGWLTVKRLRAHAAARHDERLRDVLTVNLFFFAFLSFLVLAYLTHKQPIIFPRYGLILFALGAPLLPWAFLEIKRRKTAWARKLLISIIALCLFNASVQLVYSIGYINRERTHGAVAAYLHTQFQAKQNTRIFCDDGTVLALSNIPSENFLSSLEAPREREAFLNYLKDKQVQFLVFIDKADSTPARLFPELKSGAGNEMFQPVMHASSSFLPTDIYLYRVQD